MQNNFIPSVQRLLAEENVSLNIRNIYNINILIYTLFLFLNDYLWLVSTFIFYYPFKIMRLFPTACIHRLVYWSIYYFYLCHLDNLEALNPVLTTEH